LFLGVQALGAVNPDFVSICFMNMPPAGLAGAWVTSSGGAGKWSKELLGLGKFEGGE
jgi:hypothetical protein